MFEPESDQSSTGESRIHETHIAICSSRHRYFLKDAHAPQSCAVTDRTVRRNDSLGASRRFASAFEDIRGSGPGSIICNRAESGIRIAKYESRVNSTAAAGGDGIVQIGIERRSWPFANASSRNS